MRSARANDYWKKVYSSKERYSNYLTEMCFQDCNGLSDTIRFLPGITVLCGLNGAGKSSIIASIKGLLGIDDCSVVSKKKFDGQVSAKIKVNKEEKIIANESTAIDQGLDADLIKYIDCDQSVECLKFWEQSNLEELLESEEEHTFSKEQIEEISFIVGKDYSACMSYELSDEEKTYTTVFFKVKEGAAEYDSLGMGLGEHFLFYIYYTLENIKNDSLLLIEEPESFVSILSQKRILDHFAKVISEKRISMIVSTHSPYILTKIVDAHIRLINNYNGNIIVYHDGFNENVGSILGVDDIAKNKDVTIFVEDYAARVCLECLLQEELPSAYKKAEIVSLDGESSITERLKFNDSSYISHKFIGIYDGDMRAERNEEKIKSTIHWPHLFLPVDECIEKEIINLLKSNENIKILCSELKIDYAWFVSILSKRNGEDHHDRIINICKDINKRVDLFISSFYKVWKHEKQEDIQKFISDISGLL